MVDSHPFGNDTVEWHNDAHDNHHPNRVDPIGHWIVTSSFTDYGDRTGYHDPASSTWSEYDVQPTFRYQTTAFVNTFLQENGITW